MFKLKCWWCVHSHSSIPHSHRQWCDHFLYEGCWLRDVRIVQYSDWLEEDVIKKVRSLECEFVPSFWRRTLSFSVSLECRCLGLGVLHQPNPPPSPHALQPFPYNISFTGLVLALLFSHIWIFFSCTGRRATHTGAAQKCWNQDKYHYIGKNFAWTKVSPW